MKQLVSQDRFLLPLQVHITKWWYMLNTYLLVWHFGRVIGQTSKSSLIEQLISSTVPLPSPNHQGVPLLVNVDSNSQAVTQQQYPTQQRAPL